MLFAVFLALAILFGVVSAQARSRAMPTEIKTASYVAFVVMVALVVLLLVRALRVWIGQVVP